MRYHECRMRCKKRSRSAVHKYTQRYASSWRTRCRIPRVSDEVQKEIQACRAQIHVTLCFWSADTAPRPGYRTERGDVPALVHNRKRLPVASQWFVASLTDTKRLYEAPKMIYDAQQSEEVLRLLRIIDNACSLQPNGLSRRQKMRRGSPTLASETAASRRCGRCG